MTLPSNLTNPTDDVSFRFGFDPKTDDYIVVLCTTADYLSIRWLRTQTKFLLPNASGATRAALTQSISLFRIAQQICLQRKSGYGSNVLFFKLESPPYAVKVIKK
ncbi:hypothetical protein Tco_0579415 [Tanacetum coccineum]